MAIYLNIFLVLFFAGTISFTHADPCNSNFGRCDRRNGLCWGTGRSTHFCSCKAGYKEDRNTRYHLCIDVDECREEDNICGDNAICQNTEGSYRCTCRCGYVMDYTGQRCLDASSITDMCLVPSKCYHSNPILRNFFGTAGEVPFSTEYARDYIPDFTSFAIARRPTRQRSCKCEEGFTFNHCGYCVDVNECQSNPCRGPRSFCTNTEGSFYCGCRAPYVLGPCKERCYNARDVPELCQRPRLGVFRMQRHGFRMFNQPIILQNYRECADGVSASEDTTERYDLDNDGVPDVRLTWHCVSNDGLFSTSVLKNYAEQEARWDDWSCWTACKATCWGGLQTRTRVCLHGLPGQEGCRGSGSEKRECYTGRKCRFRIRKDAETLTKSEINDLVQAMRKYKADTTVKGFHSAASSHGWPFLCDRFSCCPHGAKVKFLTWHRSIVLNYEEGLSRYLNDKTLGIPYWNWLRRDRSPPHWAWDKFIDGRENPFANMTVLIDRGGSMRTIQRDSTLFTRALDFAADTWLRVASTKKKAHIMHEFAESLENAHGGPHVSACGNGFQSEKCTISLATLDYAGFDPLFMLHHSQVDRLWAVSQRDMAIAKSTTWTPQTALEALEERGDFGRRFMPFGNTSLNAFPIVQATNTMRDSYYYEELTGVKYDTLARNGLPLSVSRALRPGGDERLFIGHYLQNTRVNFYVNYYLVDDGSTIPCSRLNESERVGSSLRQGNGNDWRLGVPQLIPMEKVGINTGGLDFDFVVKACFTSHPTCKERCPELRTTRILTQPDPMTVLYIRNQPVDVYKFLWSEGKRFPRWYINLHSGSQWIYFHGNRRSNIRQVRSPIDYITCNSRRSRPFRCALDNGNACMLPSGIYFLIDSNAGHCRNGLRMAIVSGK